MATKQRSRINKRVEEQTKKTIVASSVGSILIIVGLYFIGPKIISGLSLLMVSRSESLPAKKEDVFVTSPILDPLSISTNSAIMVVSGIAQKERKIKLYVNDTKSGEMETGKDGTFEFKRVKLVEGKNEIHAVSLYQDKESNDSQSQTVTYLSKAPTLSIDSPSDGHEVKGGEKRVTITGKTDSGSQITINDIWVLTEPDGKFSYSVQLKDGDNDIKILATDDAGNNTEMKRMVKYSP